MRAVSAGCRRIQPRPVRALPFPTAAAWVALLSSALVGNCWALVVVTENFDLGTGTRFDTFQGNDVVRTDLGSTIVDPEEGDREMGFGPQLLDHDNLQTNQFGLTNTNHVGLANGSSSAGEFGGQFNWLDYGYGADTNLGNLTIGDATQADPIKIQASMLLRDFGANNDENTTIGYFSENVGLNPDTQPFNTVGDADDMRNRDGFGLQPSNTIMAGIGFVGDGRFFLHVIGSESDVIDRRGDPTNPVTLDVPIAIDLNVFCFECDQASATAVIQGTVNGHEVQHTRSIGSGNDLFQAFGIGQSFLNRQSPPTAWRRSVAFFDDVTYSVDVDGGIDNPDPFRFGAADPINAGDYNDDGVVDDVDYVIWRDAVGSSTILANDPIGGVVGPAQFDQWKSNFGNVGTRGAASLIPEPHGGVMLVLLAFCAALRRHPFQGLFC